jgi:hypothetical protein
VHAESEEHNHEATKELEIAEKVTPRGRIRPPRKICGVRVPDWTGDENDLRDGAGPETWLFQRTLRAGKVCGQAFYPRPVCGILSALRVLAAYLIRA